jgi:hypothetical protein
VIKNVQTLAAMQSERPDFYFPNGYFRIALAEVLDFRLPTVEEICNIMKHIPGETVEEKMTHIGRLHIP